MKINKFKLNKGFTLTEMLVAVGIFVTIVTFALGAILSIFDANRRARNAKTAVDNLNLAIEDMTRTIRFGEKYHCDSSNDSVNGTSDCPNPGGGNRLAVVFEGDTITYRLNGGAIERSDLVDGGGTPQNYKDITAPEVVINYLKFYVVGTPAGGDTGQPYAVAVIGGYVGNKPTTQSVFNIQTVMSQRKLDL